MAKAENKTIIKKYANRRLYNTVTSTYVTLEDLAVMVKAEEDFTVVDAKSGDDITRSVLTQIIFEQEAKGQNLLPVDFLRNLIQFYDNSMQAVVPGYLDHSMKKLMEQQESIREQLGAAFDPQATLDVINEQTRRNAEMFQNAMNMFNPFMAHDESTATEEKKAEENEADDLAAMKEQLAEMQEKLSKLDGDEK